MGPETRLRESGVISCRRRLAGVQVTTAYGTVHTAVRHFAARRFMHALGPLIVDPGRGRDLNAPLAAVEISNPGQRWLRQGNDVHRCLKCTVAISHQDTNAVAQAIRDHQIQLAVAIEVRNRDGVWRLSNRVVSRRLKRSVLLAHKIETWPGAA
jgi:hypothetical protein